MLTPVLMLVMAGAVNPTLEPPDFLKGANLFHSCEAALRVLDTTSSHFEDKDVAAGEGCLGYLDGFVDGGQLKTWSICVEDARISSMARVYVVYMQKNPQLLERPRSIGVLLALKEEYPCSATGAGNK